MFLELIILLFDIGLTSLVTYFIPVGHYYHYFAPLLLLIGFYFVSIGLLWVILICFSWLYPKDKEYKRPHKLASFLLRNGMWLVCFHGRVKFKIKDYDSLPKERFLLVCNHLSKFDPMLIAAKYGKLQLGFISKPTNFKVPVAGHFMKASSYLSIDRYDKLKSLEVMNEATRLIKEDLCSIGVFPEGTRMDNPHGLGEFHEGVFTIAIKANAPIVVSTIQGTEKIHKNFPKRRSYVTYNILKVLYPSDYEGMTPKAVSELVRNMMLDSIK